MAKDLIKVITTNDGVNVIESREVAKMIGKEHKDVLRMIDGYEPKDGSKKRKIVGIIPTLAKGNVTPSKYFVESSYSNNNREYKCYLCTKMGCEMLANKLTGEKGILFSAKYVNAFNEMKEAIQEVETTVQTHGVLTEKEWSNIKKKSKYLTENIHSGKSTREYIKSCDLMHLQDVIDEIYEIAKPCHGEVRYEILNSAIKTLKEISSQYDYSNPLNTFIKTVANDGVIKLQSIHTEKLVRGNNNKDKKINDLKSDIEALKPVSFDDMIMVNNYAISKNDLNDAFIDSTTGKPKIFNTREYKGWKWYFQKAMDEANIKQLFSHIDWSKPVEISYAVTCHEKNDIGNFIDALQDVVQDYFHCDDKKFLVGTQLIVGIEPDKMKRKTWLYFRNVEESNLYVNNGVVA